MSLVRFGQGVVDIRGALGGVHFKRDKSGAHCSARARRVKTRSAAQTAQRNAFSKARRYTKDPRWVSYYIYLALNNIPFPFDTIVTGDLSPDATGNYYEDGMYLGKLSYRRADGAWFIWWEPTPPRWYISPLKGWYGVPCWWRADPNITGDYTPQGGTGTATVTISLAPPPTDYQIPHLQGP